MASPPPSPSPHDLPLPASRPESISSFPSDHQGLLTAPVQGPSASTATTAPDVAPPDLPAGTGASPDLPDSPLHQPDELYIPGLTSPTLFERLPPKTGCQVLVEQYFPSHAPEPISSTCSAQQLADSHSWRLLADFAREAIVRSEPSDTHAIFELWTYRLDALLRLRLPHILHLELSSLLHTIGQTFSLSSLLLARSEASKKPLPDVVPFAILLLRARLPVLLRPTSQRALLKTADMLYELRDACRRMAVYYHSHKARRMNEQWLSRARDVTAALATLFAGHEGANARFDDPGPGCRVERDGLLASDIRVGLPDAPSVAIPLSLARGDLARADALLAQLPPAPPLVALRQVAAGEWAAAVDAWEAALADAEPNTEARVVLSNNLAVALLYSGKLHQSLKTLASIVLKYNDENNGPKKSPGPEVWEAVVFNLATLVELSTADSDLAKIEILGKFIVGSNSNSRSSGGDGDGDVKRKGKIEGVDGIRLEVFKLPVPLG